ncbi:hypothetical protein BGZ46_010157 [Entomortierella lignicola]|nr:hypothetical protein BGZ46_010157 [Entomortierella lignicola]
MNVFKSLGKFIWGNESNPELIQISSGQFHVYKLSSATRQQTRECIYIDSMATIRRTSQPFQYVLAVNRVFEEGEETLQDEEQELEDEKIFLIDEAMNFKKGVSAGATAFTWQGLSSDDAGLEYEFVCDDDTTVFTANNFEVTVYQCMYERKYQKSHFSADEEAIMAFQNPEPSFNTRSNSDSATKAAPRSPTAKRGKTPIKNEVEVKQEIDKPILRDIPTTYEGVAEAIGELNLFDSRTNLFMPQADNIRCQLLRTAKFTYWLVVIDSDGKQQLAQPVEPRMNPVFSSNHSSFIWNYFDEKHNVFSWLVRFPTEAALKEFQGVFGECMYETLNQESWTKVSTADQEYMIKTFQDVEMSDNEDHESNLENEEEYSDEEEVEEEEYEEEEEEEEEQDGFKQDKASNSQLAVGYKDRSFVVRGNKIGVFKHNDRDGLEFATTIKNISNSKGREINPTRVVLHEQDTSMVMMDPRDLDTAYKMDLEYGKIVEEWNMPGTSGVLNLVGDTKYSHLTSNKTMVGHSRTAMFRVDPRLSGSKLATTEFKQYAKGNDFTCVTTSDNGSLAMAGAKGDIKLFNSIGKNAKTALPGLGDPIIGIDVTGAGRWIIATCKSYIMLIDVLNQENKKLGFDASFPAKDKPKCIKLHLRPEHVASMKQAVSFTPARFNTGQNEEEKTIVTSTGPYVITWNFRRVKNGHYDYQIKQYSDNVVADNFKFGQDRSIIVTLPNDVTSLAKRNMASPADAFKSPITNAVLLTLFPKICRLDEYLSEHLQLEFMYEFDSLDYKELLNKTLVANNAALVTSTKANITTTSKPFPTGNKPNPEGSQNEVTGSSNILAVGYSNPRRCHSQQAENYFVNTLEAFVRSSIWETLLRRIGDAAMLYLLTSTSMFIALPNNCYCQITGPAISEQAIAKRPIQRSLLPSLSSRKRAYSKTLQTSAQEPLSGPNIPENPLDSHNENTRDLQSECNEHSRVVTDARRVWDIFLDEIRRTELSASVSLDTQMIRIFPRQYGLNNVFVKHNILGINLKKAIKTKANHPWRLRQMKQLVETMLEWNNKCKFEFLLQYHCPVKAVDDISESHDTSAATLLKCNSSFDQVTSFVHSVVKKVIPLSMFGSVENRTVILRGFKMSACTWLQDSRLQQPDSRASFYVTDSSFQRNKVFYYRHALWHLITKPAEILIQKEMFIRMEPEEVSVCKSTYAKVRLLPKVHDLRPIINLRKKSSRLVNGSTALGVRSTNQQLMNAFLILGYERSRQLSQKISSATGMSDLYQRFKQVKKKFITLPQSDPVKLFMIKVDIKKSFDSINQDKLLEIIDRILKEDKYMIHRHSKVMPSNGQIMKRFLPRAVAPSEMGSFLEFAKDQAEMSKHAVLVDKALLRLADDFLFISQNQEKAESFLKTMSDGHPDYGCFINEKKTVANFDVTLNGVPVQKCTGNDFPYCGLLVHTKTLDIRVDYSRYHDEGQHY